ncbi:MAG: ABC transporter ATP-binding protein [Blastocatellales bacterium]|nr:ABC transporter ATP-binding protein [Nitrosomonas nitrosa]MBL8172488.1 ABC transporter ATP-binding protein [Acidobacteriota bacterium]
MNAVNPMRNGLLELAAVTKRFAGRAAVENVSLTVAAGEIIALLGASGCGKTTTLRLIAGLETPDAGEIRLGGERVAAAQQNIVPPHQRGIGFVFQDLALWPHLTVEGNLDFVLASGHMPKRERKARITETLRMVRAEAFIHRSPAQLSGGEQQRVALARALVGHPRLLLLDEPMAHLDAHLKAELLGELQALQQRLQLTTVYITHDRAEAERLTPRIMLMEAGRITSH